MPKETFYIKGVVHCYFFMCANVFSHCLCGDIALYTTGNTSSRSCSAHFLCKNDLLSQKGGEKKCFVIKQCSLIYVYVYTCILTYVYALLPFSFSHSHVNIVLFKAKDPFFFFLQKTIFEQKAKKKCFVILKEKNSAHSSIYVYRHTYVHCYLFSF